MFVGLFPFLIRTSVLLRTLLLDFLTHNSISACVKMSYLKETVIVEKES